MKINLTKSSEIERTHRVQMLETMFEVPAETKLSVSLSGDIPLEERNWQIGLIVGPSGSGKSLLLKELFGEPDSLSWNSRSVIDDFPQGLPMEVITRACQSVGFNTIPAWLRPYSVLSNGEKFRAEIARTLLDKRDVLIIDEFTSVVDRQVATITSDAVGRYIRSRNAENSSGQPIRLVAASCHYDIIDWLQPDWILEPGNPCRFTWRSLQRRPSITVSISRVKYETWKLFRDFHYMSQDLNKAARCYGLYVCNENTATTGLGVHIHDNGVGTSSDGCENNTGDGRGLRIPSGHVQECAGYKNVVLSKGDIEHDDERSQIWPRSNVCEQLTNQQLSVVPPTETTQTNRIASMCGVLYRPHPRVNDIYGFTRMVTLPDFQGLGLAFVLATTVGSAYKALGRRLHSYPNHPAWIRSYQRSKDWMQVKSSGSFSPRAGKTSSVGGFGGRSCAVFMYIGPSMNLEDAKKLIFLEGEE